VDSEAYSFRSKAPCVRFYEQVSSLPPRPFCPPETAASARLKRSLPHLVISTHDLLLDMQANYRDTDSEHSSAASHVRGAGPPYDDAAARELNESRMNALRLIDESGFSCVGSGLFALPLAHRAPSQLVSLKSMPGRGYWVLYGCVGFRLPLVLCTLLILNAAPYIRYDIFAINLASVMLGYVYGHTTGGDPHLECCHSRVVV